MNNIKVENSGGKERDGQKDVNMLRYNGIKLACREIHLQQYFTCLINQIAAEEHNVRGLLTYCRACEL